MSIVHIHLLLNHVPVVGAVLGAVLLAYAVVRRSSEVARSPLSCSPRSPWSPWLAALTVTMSTENEGRTST